MNQNWIATVGRIDFVNGVLSHVPIPYTVPRSETLPGAFSVARSNVDFEQGAISIEILVKEPKAKCLIGLSGGSYIDVYSGVNPSPVAYGFCLLRNGQWEFLTGTGLGDTLPVDQWLTIDLTVRGSSLELRFNGVKVAFASQLIRRGPVTAFMQSMSPIQIKNINITTKPPVCFVVMQFTEEYNALYKEVIRPTCMKFGYEVIRGDDFYTSGLIIEDVTRLIQEAAVVIADITPDNQNVFYEVGYAHAINKPTILLSDKKRERLPFDIAGFRTLFYENTIGGKSAVEERLTKHLENLGALSTTIL